MADCNNMLLAPSVAIGYTPIIETEGVSMFLIDTIQFLIIGGAVLFTAAALCAFI